MVSKLDGHFTMRTYGVNQAFRFVEGIWVHRKRHQIRKKGKDLLVVHNMFWATILHKCHGSPSVCAYFKRALYTFIVLKAFLTAIIMQFPAIMEFKSTGFSLSFVRVESGTGTSRGEKSDFSRCKQTFRWDQIIHFTSHLHIIWK